MSETPIRPLPIPCPICGADIDPTILDNEHAIWGTDIQRILNAIPGYGCFAVPGYTHSTWKWEEGAAAAKEMYNHLTQGGKDIELLGTQHAWAIVRGTITPSYSPYAWIPQRLREITVRSFAR